MAKKLLVVVVQKILLKFGSFSGGWGLALAQRGVSHMAIGDWRTAQAAQRNGSVGSAAIVIAWR